MAVPLSLAFLLSWVVSGVQAEQQQTGTHETTISAFNDRVKQYIKLRGKVEEQLPKLSDKSQPPEIETHKAVLQANIITARSGAKSGDIFTTDIANHIRGVIKQEFTGKRLNELRESVKEAQTKGVPLRVNVPYPETKELIEMPPSVLKLLLLLGRERCLRTIVKRG